MKFIGRNQSSAPDNVVYTPSTGIQPVIDASLPDNASSAHQRPDDVFGEWNKLSQEEWNFHQRMAERTKGIATLANLVSLAGAAITASGLWDYRKGREGKALLKITVGRLLDLADGEVSTRLGTRSKAGAAIDAGADKLLTVAATAVLVETGTVSKSYAALTLGQQARIVKENAAIEKAGGKPNPSEDGKHGMGAFWTALTGRVAERSLTKHGYEKAAAGVGTLAAGAELVAIDLNQSAGDGYALQRKTITK